MHKIPLYLTAFLIRCGKESSYELVELIDPGTNETIDFILRKKRQYLKPVIGGKIK